MKPGTCNRCGRRLCSAPVGFDDGAPFVWCPVCDAGRKPRADKGARVGAVVACLIALALGALLVFCASCGRLEDDARGSSSSSFDGLYVGTYFDGNMEPDAWRLDFPAMQWTGELVIAGGELCAIADELVERELSPPELGLVVEWNEWTETRGRVVGRWTPLELRFELDAAFASSDRLLVSWSVYAGEQVLQSRTIVFGRVQ